MAASKSVCIPSCWIIAFVGLLGAASVAHAANDCPWINETTASSLLGGDATGVYKAGSEGKPAVCTFTQAKAQGGQRTLEVTIEVVTDPQGRLTQSEHQCGPDAAPLHAIGNQAIFCAADDRPDVRGERAIGRVRDQLFTISLQTSVKDDPVLNREALKSRIYIAAEQVAGSLF